MTKEFLDTLSNEELKILENRYRKRDIAIFPIGILWVIVGYYIYLNFNYTYYIIVSFVIFTVWVINHNVEMRKIDRILTDRAIELDKLFFLEDIVLGISLLFLVAFFVFQAKFYNDFRYGTRFDEKRKEYCLYPFQENYKHSNFYCGGDIWENTSKNRQGLYLELKQQNRRWNFLDFEMDRLVYKEGDSIKILLETMQNFNNSNDFYYFNSTKGDLLLRLKFTEDNKENYKLLFAYLKHRGDSLQLNKE